MPGTNKLAKCPTAELKKTSISSPILIRAYLHQNKVSAKSHVEKCPANAWGDGPCSWYYKEHYLYIMLYIFGPTCGFVKAVATFLSHDSKVTNSAFQHMILFGMHVTLTVFEFAVKIYPILRRS